MLNFLCIGAQKSATTWLYKTLLKHPRIAFPGGKEVHFWNGEHSGDVDWYLNLFSDDTHINGDITPAYAMLPKEDIEKIYNLLPNLHLIYLIRNPIERAWSSARMALARAEMASDEGSDQWFIDHFMSRGSLARGDYENCIKRWRSVFPSNQLLILRYENITENPVLVANAVLNFIGLESLFSEKDEQKLREKVFKGDDIVLRPSLIAVLQDIYRDRIDSLEKYLQEDFSCWMK